MTGEPEYARRNDFVDYGGAWGLCECCGLHRFSDDGTRLCVTHPADADVSAEPCQRCLELIR